MNLNSFRYLIFLVCYLLGAVPFGYITGRLKGIDVRRFGSGNIGATNVFRLLGPPAVIVLVCDIGKGVGAAALGTWLFPQQPALQVLAGLTAVVGHNWSVFLGFRGGKGVATTAGVFLYLMPGLLGVGVLVFLLVVAVTRYVSLGSLSLAAVLALGSLVCSAPTPFISAAWVVFVFVVYQHRSNLSRLLAGTESRFGEHITVPPGARKGDPE